MTDTQQAYNLGAAFAAEIPARDCDNWRAFGEHDEIPDGDYHELQRLYPAEIERALSAYRQGFHDAWAVVELRTAIAASGLSARQYATQVLTRDERTIRRWLAGDSPIPQAVLEFLARSPGQ